MKNFVMLKKNILLAAVLFLSIPCVFTEAYLVKLPQNSEHYVIDDNVNVRAEPNLNGKKLFKLNTGDKVVILSKSLADYDFSKGYDGWEKAEAEAESEQFLLTEGLWAPWYRIRCDKGEGYICGRYLSCKELELDTDCDGKTEVLVCLSTAKKKGTLKFNENFYGDSYFFPYWEEGLKNEDVNHILIKDKKAIPIDFSDGKAFKDGTACFALLDTSSFSPPLCVLIIESAVRTYGGGEDEKDCFYFAGNKFVHLFSNHSVGWDGGNTDFYEISTDKNQIIVEHEHYVPYLPFPDSEYERSQIIEHSQTFYTWNGKSFSSQTKEFEIEYSKEYLEHMENNEK